ncbi:FK506-binding protein 5 [Saguinus oedipus]|uniref:peptidylprolyl isomerase n=1 Tax=Saguinus oedipus TaxID=9490 RepID=A0ABQ9VW01_SAGOE|nr:FK506-binding protein 5 [Saguinus oedipus]
MFKRCSLALFHTRPSSWNRSAPSSSPENPHQDFLSTGRARFLRHLLEGGKYVQAVIQYGKIVSWLEMEYGLSEKESKASESFLLAAFLNLAMCYLKLREYAKAVECCDKTAAALGLDSANEKGLYRRGEAQLLMNEFESAKGDFEKVLEVNPQNKAARLQIVVCQKKAKEHNERDRRIYANMFKKFAEQDAKEEANKAVSKKTSEGVTNEKLTVSHAVEEEKPEGHV